MAESIKDNEDVTGTYSWSPQSLTYDKRGYVTLANGWTTA